MKKKWILISGFIVLAIMVVCGGLVLGNMHKNAEVSKTQPKTSLNESDSSSTKPSKHKVAKTATKANNDNATDDDSQSTDTNDNVSKPNTSNESVNSQTNPSSSNAQSTSSVKPVNNQSQEQNGMGNVVNSTSQAVTVLKNGLGNNPDYTYQVTSTANDVYEIQVNSKSQGSPVGIYRVMKDGTFGVRP